VDKIEAIALAKAKQERSYTLHGDLLLQGLHAREAEDRVVQIGAAIPINASSSFMQMAFKKGTHRFRGIAQLRCTTPRDLQHLDA
jgi:hypothetical protein